VRGGWKMELAGREDPPDWPSFARGLLGPQGELLAYSDPGAGQWRFAAFDGRRLLGALFVAREPVAVARSWLADRLVPQEDEANRLRVLAGRPGGTGKERGPTICACFEVGLNQIIEAVTTRGCLSVDAVGVLLKAGTNCGSCRSEIRRIIDEDRVAKAG